MKKLTEQQAGMGDTNVDTNPLVALVEALADAQIVAGWSLAGVYVKAKPSSFSGKKKDWLLSKMQLQVYLLILGLEGVVEETSKQELPQQQYSVLDTTDLVQASANVTQVLVLGFKKLTLVNTIAMSKSAEWPVGNV